MISESNICAIFYGALEHESDPKTSRETETGYQFRHKTKKRRSRTGKTTKICREMALPLLVRLQILTACGTAFWIRKHLQVRSPREKSRDPFRKKNCWCRAFPPE